MKRGGLRTFSGISIVGFGLRALLIKLGNLNDAENISNVYELVSLSFSFETRGKVRKGSGETYSVTPF